MDSYDIKKHHRELYAPRPGDVTIVDVPEFSYLMVDGEGDPNTVRTYREAVEALYNISYGVRLAAKRDLGRVHVVAPLEGLWRSPDPTDFTARRKGEWQWTMMIHQPEWITQDMVDAANTASAEKKPNPALSLLRFETYTEGRAVQALHVGPYDAEGPLIARMHEHAHANGHTLRGKHHEIYLSDPRKVAPAKLKTVLRQPVALPRRLRQTSTRP